MPTSLSADENSNIISNVVSNEITDNFNTIIDSSNEKADGFGTKTDVSNKKTDGLNTKNGFFINADDSAQFRLMSYNVRNGRGMDDRLDYDRTAAVINQHNPDVVFLQELDCRTIRSGQKDTLEELASRTKMVGTFAGAISFQGGEYGIGILTREKPISVQKLSLPGKEEERVLLCVELEDCFLLNTHFSLREKDRLTSAKMINHFIGQGTDSSVQTEKTLCSVLNETQKPIQNSAQTPVQKPIILAGDFNETPQEPAISELKKVWKHWDVAENSVSSSDSWSGASYPANKPEIDIDHFFGYLPENENEKKMSFRVQAEVVNAPNQSDHRPLLLVLRK